MFISGAFSSYEQSIEEYSHDISRSLASSLLEHNYRIVNGIGRRFGTHLIGYANEYLARQGIKNAERYLIVKPFVSNNKNAAIEKKRLREKVIGQCGACIFVFGDSDKNAINAKSGVLEEFEIACKQHKVVIPIAYPNMVSEEIWQEVKFNLTKFPYLEGKIDNLTSSNSTILVCELITHILESVQ